MMIISKLLKESPVPKTLKEEQIFNGFSSLQLILSMIMIVLRKSNKEWLK
jgi:hypothetical protein